jgi:hypothetical protein
LDVYEVGNGIDAALVSRGNLNERTVTGARGAGMSFDGAHKFFTTTSHLVPEDAARTAGEDLYVRHGGRTSLVALASDGRLISSCGSMLGGASINEGSARNAISSDASRVTFSTPDVASGSGDPDCLRPIHIYQRNTSGQTIDVSSSQAAVADPNGPANAIFEGAARDGLKIVFSSTERLVDGASAGGGIYEFNVSTRRLRLLVGDSDVSVLKVADDARLIYFLSGSEIEPGVGGVPSLWVYRTETGRSELIASDPLNTLGFDLDQIIEVQRPLATSVQGDLAFATSATLTPFDNRTRREVYLYRQAERRLWCVSCDPAGQRANDSTATKDASLLRPRTGVSRASFSADGRRFVFESGDQLISEDVNAKIDVYEFANDRVELVTSGRSEQDAYLAGISDDGRTVLFSTFESLLHQDRDNGNQDMYVARFDGFPKLTPEDEEARCVADSCQGAQAGPPGTALLGSEVFAGAEATDVGVIPPLRNGRVLGVRLPKPRAMAAVARTGVVPIVVRVRGAGSYGLRMLTQIRGRRRIVGRAVKRMTSDRAQAITFRVRLNRPARTVLTRSGRLELTVETTVDGVRVRRSEMTLTSSAAKGLKR